jgi:transglutaminase-like putative cysteine protease
LIVLKAAAVTRPRSAHGAVADARSTSERRFGVAPLPAEVGPGTGPARNSRGGRLANRLGRVHTYGMTCSLVTPWWRLRVPVHDSGGVLDSVAGELDRTRILDWDAPSVRSLAGRVTAFRNAGHAAGLRMAHRLIARSVRPVYSTNDKQPISRTLRLGRGSCSQRMAILEGVARSQGIPTRVRGILVDGRFWYPRFRRMTFLVPSRVLLAWPEFLVAGGWIAIGELFGTLPELAAAPGAGFTNSGGETLFDAVARTAVDWDGLVCGADGSSACDLSATVLADLGRFGSRDEMFARHGQTLCAPLTVLTQPFLSRWAPPSTAHR